MNGRYYAQKKVVVRIVGNDEKTFDNGCLWLKEIDRLYPKGGTNRVHRAALKDWLFTNSEEDRVLWFRMISAVPCPKGKSKKIDHLNDNDLEYLFQHSKDKYKEFWRQIRNHNLEIQAAIDRFEPHTNSGKLVDPNYISGRIAYWGMKLLNRQISARSLKRGRN
jgi:hypothetical protein